MARAFVSIGSNIDAPGNVRRALGCLAAQTRVAAISMVYLTDALGRPEQDPYYNCVVEIETELPAQELKARLLRPIEDQLGRVRSADKYAPRTIDLDLIAYADLAVDADGLRLPDPDITERAFLAMGLRELAPGWILPGSNQRIDDIADRLPQKGMRRLTEYTRRLQQEFVR